jgi:hypothetical protein
MENEQFSEAVSWGCLIAVLVLGVIILVAA